MFEIFKHNLRQYYYEYFKLPACKFFYVFEKIYFLAPDIWDNLTYDEQNKGFIITDFIDSSLKDYSGREVAFFNASRVYVFWLPGAQHSGQGHVKNGNYQVVLNCNAMKEPVLLNVNKTCEGVKLDGLTSIKALPYSALPGGYVIYSAITREIKSRILDALIRVDPIKQRAIGDLLLK
jgi:hypothetical protein